MKNIIFVLILISIISCKSEIDNVIHRPLVEHVGFGPFYIGFRGISYYDQNSNSPWATTHLKVSGIPLHWKKIRIGDIQSNIYQMTYQNFISGNLSKQFYVSIQDSWNWNPDTINLSKQPLKCQIAFVTGIDESGKLKMIVDKNNNQDFNDDNDFYPIEVELTENQLDDTLITNNLIFVSVERFINNKIINDSIPLAIAHISNYDMLVSCFPLYATTELDNQDVAIITSGFDNTSYATADLVLSTGLPTGQKSDIQKTIKKNEFLKVNDRLYRFIGVNTNSNTADFELINDIDSLQYSPQVGFRTIPFSGNDIISNDSISIENYPNKYLFIEFWSQYCGPCIQELPFLKSIYEKADKTKMDFIGVVCSERTEWLDTLIVKNQIDWPLIISNKDNDIEKKYKVSGYPTSFLVDSKGIIIAKNLRGKKLDKKLNELKLLKNASR